MQLLYSLYLGKLSRPKCHEFSPADFPNAKLSPLLFYLLIIQLSVYKRTITSLLQTIRLFISEWDGRCDWLQTTAEHARRRLQHLSWRSRWIILCTLEQRMTVSCEISRADRRLFGLSSWLSMRSSTARRLTRSAAASLPDCTRLADSLQQTVDASKFPTLVGQFTQQSSCTILLWQIEILNHNRKFLRNFHDCV